MGGPDRPKILGSARGMCPKVVHQIFFEKVHLGKVGGPHVPLLDHGDEIETLNWACKSYWPCLVDPINSYVMANSTYMPNLVSLSHPHGLEEAPVVH